MTAVVGGPVGDILYFSVCLHMYEAKEKTLTGGAN